MDPAGMVDALAEIRNVLKHEGVLNDIRPLADRWHVEVVSARGSQQTGRVDDLPEQVQGDMASNRAMSEVEQRGWFQREQETFFPFFYSWDTPSEMEEFIAEDWSEFILLGEEARRSNARRLGKRRRRQPGPCGGAGADHKMAGRPLTCQIRSPVRASKKCKRSRSSVA